MAHIDILPATIKAYRTAWDERSYLLRLAAIPFLIKLFCFSMAISYAGQPEDHLRFTLIMIPALMAEGWMVSHFVRLLVFGQRWPFRPTGNLEADLAVLAVRARGVLSGMIVFVLANMALGALMAFVGVYIMPYLPEDSANTAAVEIPGHIAFISFVMVIAIFWGFRLMWMYIPYAVGMDWRSYLTPLRGAMTSFHMIALYFLCFVPLFLGMVLLKGLFAPIVQSIGGDAGASVLMVLVTVLADTLKVIFVTGGMTYALMEIFKQEKNEGR